jgi:hypothetical protein
MKDEMPEILNIRDTSLHDDMGGLGRRIYTTAGQGYDTTRYMREDIAIDRQQRVTEVINEINDMLSGSLTGEDAYAVVDYLIEAGWRK